MLKKVKFFFQDKNNLFQNSLFPAVIIEWINVDICHSASCNVFKKVILKIIRPNVDTNVDSSEGLKLLTRIRLGLRHLADHKFRHIQDCIDPICSCSQKIETSTHFLLHYHCARHTLIEKVS